jgi:hypothetical protein
MSQSNSKYFCLLKGNWQERFFELIEMFQISLHEKFAIGVPDRPINPYNRIIVYGLSLPEGSCADSAVELTDQEISDSFYGGNSEQGVGLPNYSTIADLENSSVNLFEHQLSYN